MQLRPSLGSGATCSLSLVVHVPALGTASHSSSMVHLKKLNYFLLAWVSWSVCLCLNYSLPLIHYTLTNSHFIQFKQEYDM